MYFNFKRFLVMLQGWDETATYKMGKITAMGILPPLHLSN